MASISNQLSQLTLNNPFRFSDLPSEIRNKIYTIILCTVDVIESDEIGVGLHKVPDEITMLRHSIETEILRTCRTVYAEANYVMRKTNLFIRVTVKIPFYQLSPSIIAKRLPILPISREKANGFKGFVMSHEITPRDAAQEGRTFAILFRDMDRWCSLLSDAKWKIDRFEEQYAHVVTLVDPYDDAFMPDSPTFYSRTLQEKLIAPYRAKLRGFPHFEIKGTIPHDLSRAALSDISRSPADDPESILDELEGSKAKGNEFFRAGNGELASENWCQGLMKIRRVTGGAAGQQLLKVGGVDFANRLAALAFGLNSNRAQNTLRAMRDNGADPELVQALSRSLFHAVDEAKGSSSLFPGVTWRPLPQQMAKLFFMEAVACRLAGTWDLLSQAEIAIDSGLGRTPDDAELKREKVKISQWRRRVRG